MLFWDKTNAQSPLHFPSTIDACEIGACEEVQNDISLPCISEQNVETDITYNSTDTQTPKLPMFTIDNFEKDDAGIHFYTGLENYGKFFFVLHTLGPAAYCLQYAYHHVSNISVPDQFFLVLMKLRRHTTNFELSRLFGIAESVVSNVFVTWIIFMEKQWK